MKVLFADDCPITRAMVASFLESEGYVVYAVESREQLLQMLESGLRPRVVVTDNSMPERDEGVRVLQYIRENPGLSHLPVIVHSSDDGGDGPSGESGLRKVVEGLGGMFAEKTTPPFDKLLVALRNSCQGA